MVRRPLSRYTNRYRRKRYSSSSSEHNGQPWSSTETVLDEDPSDTSQFGITRCDFTGRTVEANQRLQEPGPFGTIPSTAYESRRGEGLGSTADLRTSPFGAISSSSHARNPLEPGLGSCPSNSSLRASLFGAPLSTAAEGLFGIVDVRTVPAQDVLAVSNANVRALVASRKHRRIAALEEKVNEETKKRKEAMESIEQRLSVIEQQLHIQAATSHQSAQQSPTQSTFVFYAQDHESTEAEPTKREGSWEELAAPLTPSRNPQDRIHELEYLLAAQTARADALKMERDEWAEKFDRLVKDML